MASGLFDMLADLARNQGLLAAFKHDPDSVMDKYNLSEEQKAHLKSSLHDGKHHDFFKAIGDEAHKQFSRPDMLFC